jgi:L-ascorbate metabolism protein UlaG (beta-lactamase superfamily)
MTEKVKIRYYGWSALSLQTEQGTLYFDPFFRDYCGALWFRLQDFSDAKYICVTHGHEEHFLDVPEVATRFGATVIGPPSVTRFLRSRHKLPDDRLIAMKEGDTQQLPGFKITTFKWKHRDINLVKAISKAVFQGNTTQLAWVWSSVTNAPFYAPYTGYHVELPNGMTVLNYNEGFNTKMTDAEIQALGKRFKTDVLLAGMQLDFVGDVARGAKALNPKIVLLYPPHDKFHAMMGAKSRPWQEFAAAVQEALPNAKVIIADPGTAIDALTGEVIESMPQALAA